MMHPRQARFLARLVLASSAVALASGFAAAAEEPPNPRSVAAALGPSRLDFMVFASMADSPHLLAMAGYRPAQTPCATRSTARGINPGAGKGLRQCRL